MFQLLSYALDLFQLVIHTKSTDAIWKVLWPTRLLLELTLWVTSPVSTTLDKITATLAVVEAKLETLYS